MNKQNPLIYTHSKEPNSNQSVYRYSYLKDILQHQVTNNSNLTQSIETFHSTLQDTSHTQQAKHDELLQELGYTAKALREIGSILNEQTKTNQIILDRLEKLEEENELVLNKITKEELMHEAMVEQLSLQDQKLTSFHSSINNHEVHSVELSKQLQVHENMYEEIHEKLGLQEVFHRTVMERLDHQEARSERIQRQIDYLKTAIYERASHLAEKIETNFSKVTKPVHRFFIQKEKQEQK